jgi:hypothetical protein
VAARKEGNPVNTLVLDAGALIAIDRNDRDVHKTVRDAHRMGVQVLTNSMAVAQVWRDSKGRQATLAKVLRGLRVQAVLRMTDAGPESCSRRLACPTRSTPAWPCWRRPAIAS